MRKKMVGDEGWIRGVGGLSEELCCSFVNNVWDVLMVMIIYLLCKSRRSTSILYVFTISSSNPDAHHLLDYIRIRLAVTNHK
jgi:hypothetical protein